MITFDLCPAPEGIWADFAVTVTDKSLFPWFRPGDTVWLRRRVDLRDGDVGLFFLDGEMVFRQFCQDCFGTIYLFSLNREQKSCDRVFSGETANALVCYGRAELPRQIPLPMD